MHIAPDPLVATLAQDFDSTAADTRLRLLFARAAADDEQSRHDASFAERGHGQFEALAHLGARWFNATRRLTASSSGESECSAFAKAFFGHFDAVHVSAEISALQTLGLALESFAQLMLTNEICASLPDADAAIEAAFDNVELLVLMRLRRALEASELASTAALSIRDRLSIIDCDLLLRVVTRAAQADPQRFARQLQQIENPGRTHFEFEVEGLHKYRVHEELEDGTLSAAAKAAAILNKPLVEFESSVTDQLSGFEHVSHFVTRVYGYLRRLKKTDRRRVLVIAQDEVWKVLAATQVALSLSNASVQGLTPANKIAFTPSEIAIEPAQFDHEALALRLEWAGKWASDLGVASTVAGCAEADWMELLTMHNVDMFVVFGVLTDIVTTQQRPTMLKLPTDAVNAAPVWKDRDPVIYGRTWKQSASKWVR
ncbi:MAG: hypothetical protein MHM6MM_003546 [Cercozoa sp. M6MM]